MATKQNIKTVPQMLDLPSNRSLMPSINSIMAIATIPRMIKMRIKKVPLFSLTFSFTSSKLIHLLLLSILKVISPWQSSQTIAKYPFYFYFDCLSPFSRDFYIQVLRQSSCTYPIEPAQWQGEIFLPSSSQHILHFIDMLGSIVC